MEALRRTAGIHIGSQSNVDQFARCAIPSHAYHVGLQSSDVLTTRTASHVSGARPAGDQTYANTLPQAPPRSIASPSDHARLKTLQTRRQEHEILQPIVAPHSRAYSAVMTRACRTASAARCPPMPQPRRTRHRCRYLRGLIRLIC
jgi:hypothetical protein